MNIPGWARQAHDDWQTAIDATRRMQEMYNQWLARIDREHFEASQDEIPAVRELREQLRTLLSIQIQYFQQITPWMDAKIQELRLEENHNVTFHVGSLVEKINELQLQITALERQIRTGITPPSNANVNETAPSKEAPTEKDYRYHAFEQIFRQPSAELKETLNRYVPLFQNSPEPILDLGCGRGEFLRLMNETGKKAYGVDISTYETEQLRKSGLEAVAADLGVHLSKLEPGSTGGVFCAQVVEHLSPDAVYEMLASLHRVMKTDAPLVIETVNPLSVFGYHHLFFKDPTHVFPVHPDTLVFLLRYAGFHDVQLHLITPVPQQQKLPDPRKEEFSPAAYEYLKAVSSRLNNLLYDSLEYYVVGYRK